MENTEAVRSLQVTELETSHSHSRYLVAHNGRYWEINAAVADLIAAFRQSGTVAEAASVFSALRHKCYTEQEVSLLADRFIAPLLQESSGPADHPFWLKVNLLGEAQVLPFSNRLKFLFRKPWMIALLGLSVVLEILFYSLSEISLAGLGNHTLGILIGIILLYAVSSLFHELGHASACRHFGVKHGGIGFGLYLTFPVFFTDVSAVWTLPRRQRLVVNFAGVYFQLLFLMPLIGVALWHPNDFLNYFIVALNLNFLLTMNPFFKFDGYWMMCDLLGVPNLRKRTQELFVYAWRKWRGKPVGKRPFLLDIRPVEKAVAIGYTLVVNLFFGYYFLVVIPAILARFISDFPSLSQRVFNYLAVGRWPDSVLLQQFFSQLLAMGLIVFFFYNLLRPWARKWKGQWQAKRFHAAKG